MRTTGDPVFVDDIILIFKDLILHLVEYMLSGNACPYQNVSPVRRLL